MARHRARERLEARLSRCTEIELLSTIQLYRSRSQPRRRQLALILLLLARMATKYAQQALSESGRWGP